MKSSMQSLLCLVVTGPTQQEASKQLHYNLSHIDMMELRLDLWETGWSLEALQALRKEFPLPVIYTLRPKRQGGAYKQDEATRFHCLKQLLALCPDYLDVEYNLPIEWLEELRHNIQIQHNQLQKSTRLIHSYHQMNDIQKNLDIVYQTLCARKRQNDIIKIACTPQSSLEAFQLLEWTKRHATQGNTLVIGMGEYGAITRLCAPCVNVPWSYVHGNDQTQTPVAPGQFSCKTMRTLYHYSSLHEKTPLYGLLGNPVTSSISQWSHNLFFQLFSLPALYVKCTTNPQELPELLHLSAKLGFHGFSITHPLKEQIIPHLDALDIHAQTIQAVNTLRLEEGKWVGYNTDGAGALTALQSIGEIEGKHVILLGSGGCAKAIAHTLKQFGCVISIMSRNPSIGESLAHAVKGRYLNWNLDALQAEKDAYLIQATSSLIEITPKQLDSISCVFETRTLPKKTPLIQAAYVRGCPVVYGYSMFAAQALKQMALWFPHYTEQEAHIHSQVSAWQRLIASAVSNETIPDFLSPIFLPSSHESCYYKMHE